MKVQKLIILQSVWRDFYVVQLKHCLHLLSVSRGNSHKWIFDRHLELRYGSAILKHIMPSRPPAQVERQIQRKRKVRAAAKEALEARGRRKDFLQQLPLELLLQILSYSTVTTMLSVARTCKWLLNTVVDPLHSSIWVAARKCFLPEAPPEPTSNVTEIAYASILFEGGTCYVSGHTGIL